MSKIKLSLPQGELIHTGKQITFQAPCSCSKADSLVIDGETYSLVTSSGVSLANTADAFSSGALVSVLVDVETKKAYVINSDVSNTVKTINGTSIKFFEGTQEEFNKLRPAQRQHVLPHITDDTTKEDLETLQTEVAAFGTVSTTVQTLKSDVWTLQVNSMALTGRVSSVEGAVTEVAGSNSALSDAMLGVQETLEDHANTLDQHLADISNHSGQLMSLGDRVNDTESAVEGLTDGSTVAGAAAADSYGNSLINRYLHLNDVQFGDPFSFEIACPLSGAPFLVWWVRDNRCYNFGVIFWDGKTTTFSPTCHVLDDKVEYPQHFYVRITPTSKDQQNAYGNVHIMYPADPAYDLPFLLEGTQLYLMRLTGM